jgi:hypothetical protein
MEVREREGEKMTMKTISYGFHPGMDFDAYSAIDAINYSSLKHMMRSPMKYRYEKDHPQPPTDAMILGTASHRMILEPEKIGGFAVWGETEDQKSRRGKVWDAFEAANSGKLIVTASQRDNMVGMAVAVRKGPAARYLYFKGEGRNEVSAVWRDKASGLDFKGRIDRLVKVGGSLTVVDLKTTRDCHPYRFGNEFYRLGYAIQAAMYREAVFYIAGELPEYVVVAIDQKPPHESAVYRLTDSVLQVGKDDLSRLLIQLRECVKSGRWPGAIPEETELQLPAFVYGEHGDEADLGDLELVMD